MELLTSLLFQRGLYAPEYFKMTKKYGLNMLVTTDPQIKNHMREILKQVEAWLMACKVEKLILAIKSKETMTVLERWQFDIQNTKDYNATPNLTSLPASFGFSQQQSSPSQNQNKENMSFYNNSGSSNLDPTTSASQPSSSTKQKSEKSEKEIQTEIQAILRQITASVTFLPMLDEKCTWTILCQTERDAEVPATWSDADPHLVHNAEQVKLRSFSTNLHKIEALVAYRLQDDL
ncbi:Mitotic spindle checkpoint component mad2 [Mortierella sp. AM989]|nr:Mitotic spindle checkpoint component mad2 [Mortierella sp. AM989]